MPIPSHILDIDIGKIGGVALLDHEGVLLDVEPMPTLDDGPWGRPAVNPALLAALVRGWAPTKAFVEYVSAQP